MAKPTRLKTPRITKSTPTLNTAVDTALAGTQPERIDVGGDVYYLRPAIVVKEGGSTYATGLISHRRVGKNYHQTWYLIVAKGKSVQRYDSQYEDRGVMHFDSKLVDRDYERVETNAQTIVQTFVARLRETL